MYRVNPRQMKLSSWIDDYFYKERRCIYIYIYIDRQNIYM